MHAVKWSTISNFVALPAAAFRNFASIEYGITRALGGRLEQRLRTTDENLRRIREQHGINIDPKTVTQVDLAKLGNTAHFLHLSYKLLLSEDLLAQEGIEYPPAEQQEGYLLRLKRLILFAFSWLKRRISGTQVNQVPAPRAHTLDPVSLNTYSVTELNNAGVTFRRVDGRKFYDIGFAKKKLEIPEIFIKEGSKARLQNLLAYEVRCLERNGQQILGDYISFMDSLINTAKDVEFLRKKEIIKHTLGSDEEVATLFNEMGAIAVRSRRFRYTEIVKKLKKHCGTRRYRQLAMLRSKYFSSTWSIISVIVATALLLLTILAAAYTIAAFYKGK